jgi:uncharacterized phage protein (TIGR02220 family)
MSFYAVTPFHILVNEDLKPNEIKLYGIISALTNTSGYCFATNIALAEYFKRDGKKPSTNTVSQWITTLVEAGFITRRVIYDVDFKTVIERQIRLCDKIEPIKLQGTNIEVEPTKQTYEHEIIQIIEYLNEKAGKKYGIGIKKYGQLIRGRFNDGSVLTDFIKVIDAKYLDDFFRANNNKLLNPETLFRPSNFDKYLNEWVEPTPEQTKYDEETEIDLTTRTF